MRTEKLVDYIILFYSILLFDMMLTGGECCDTINQVLTRSILFPILLLVMIWSPSTDHHTPNTHQDDHIHLTLLLWQLLRGTANENP